MKKKCNQPYIRPHHLGGSMRGVTSMLNKVVLVGRLTKDVELKHTQTGIANVRFTLAVKRSYHGQNGEKESDFISCVAWRKTAENMAKFLAKGSLISVDGSIQTSNFEGQDGKRVYMTDVVAGEVDFLDPKKTESNEQQPNQQQSYQQSEQQQQYQQPNQQQQYQQPNQQQQYQQSNQQQQYQQSNQQQQQYQQSNQQGSYSGASVNNNQTLNTYELPDDDLPF